MEVWLYTAAAIRRQHTVGALVSALEEMFGADTALHLSPTPSARPDDRPAPDALHLLGICSPRELRALRALRTLRVPVLCTPLLGLAYGMAGRNARATHPARYAMLRATLRAADAALALSPQELTDIHAARAATPAIHVQMAAFTNTLSPADTAATLARAYQDAADAKYQSTEKHFASTVAAQTADLPSAARPYAETTARLLHKLLRIELTAARHHPTDTLLADLATDLRTADHDEDAFAGILQALHRTALMQRLQAEMLQHDLLTEGFMPIT